MKLILILTIFVISLLIKVESHGRLTVPPARSSAWREDPARFPAYYDDAQMFCGGFQTQWGANGWKNDYKQQKKKRIFFIESIMFSLKKTKKRWPMRNMW